MEQRSSPITRADWVIDDGWVDALGHRLSDDQVFNTCIPRDAGPVGPDKNAFLQCIQNHGWHEFVTYQPGSRFWTFQAVETGIYVALAVGLLALTIWWVRRRIA